MNTNWKYCTLETAKRLRELGLPQGISDFYWKSDRTPDPYIVYKHSRYMFTAGEILCAAPDLSEAMRVLDEYFDQEFYAIVLVGNTFILDNHPTAPEFSYDNKTIFPAEAACRMIVWLAENGLINLREVEL